MLVTHDPEEAAFLSDEVIVISDGHVLQSGTTGTVFTRPASPEVARILGIPNLHHGVVVHGQQIDAHGTLIAVDTDALAPGTPILWSIRPERISVSPWAEPGGSSDGVSEVVLTGTLTDIADVGTSLELFIAIAEKVELEARTPHRVDLEVGERCRVGLPAEAITLWPAPPPVSHGGRVTRTGSSWAGVTVRFAPSDTSPLQSWAGISTPTLVAFTTASATTPGASSSSSAASRVMRATNRCGPAWISTWAATLSFTTRVTIPRNRLRADCPRGWAGVRSPAMSIANWARSAPST